MFLLNEKFVQTKKWILNKDLMLFIIGKTFFLVRLNMYFNLFFQDHQREQ